ncbi:OsmC family peroxiredoxin [Alphaproteobacteria bacterium GH1-50]|uniref:OsmC family peroxiredoxin n=1 Tax=Kangsaoukella pontilimi TaxID=2691042 RepID=A0A7C9IF57_9RHOB|nr:OsmC family protein [Kangsaoukella pontilimi]MXQ07304.1 OsmC family peroxiredoxin [Kangsaoukella pontilimi]
MRLGENIIAESGVAPFFRVSNPEAVGLTPPENRLGEAARTWVRSLSGFQKEALVVSARSGLMWRLVSDEGAYLSGHDAAPCPLAFLTTGMIAGYMNEITALAAARGVEMRGLKLTQNNYYTMQGSMRKRTMVGGALPVELEVEVDCDLEDTALTQLLMEAVAASPLNGLMRGVLPSLFTLTRNGGRIATGAAQELSGEVIPDPSGAAPLPEDTDLTLIERLGMSPRKEVAKGTAAAASSLSDEQDRTLNPAAICTLREDGIKEIEQHLYSPHGSVFRFLSDEAPVAGGMGRAPDAVSYISAGIGFCFMTQFGRMASMEKLDLPAYSIVQDTHFSLGGASGGTGQAGTADPVETHVHLQTTESDDVARDMLDVSEQTCFLHAFCRTDLKTRLKVTRP